jgi:hypothetical protein
MVGFILQSPQAFNELLRSVSGKWETISLLVLLLFFLASAAFLYAVLQAIFRPNSMVHHTIILLVCLLGGWQASSLGVRLGLSTELHRYACLDLMEKHLHSRTSAETYCAKKNPIRLKYGGAGD